MVQLDANSTQHRKIAVNITFWDWRCCYYARTQLVGRYCGRPTSWWRRKPSTCSSRFRSTWVTG